MSLVEGTIAIVGLALLTLLTRAFFLLPERDLPLPAWLQQGLRYAPLAALVAVVAPEIVLTQGELISTWKDAALAGRAGRQRVLLLAPRHPGHHRQRHRGVARAQARPGLVTPRMSPMNVLRFTDLIAQGRVAGQRVFIRADLNVPQDDAGHITEDTRIRASVPCIRMALDAGAAVMVTSHLGRPTEGAFKPEDSLAPVAARLGELLGRDGAAARQLGRRRRASTPGQVVLLENCRVNKGEKKNDEALARKMAALCDIFVHDAFGTAHRAEATHLRHRAVRQDRLRRPAAGGRDRRHHARRWRKPEAPAGGHRRRLQGQHQADHPAKPGRQGRRADRRRRHRQHLHAGRRPADRQEPGRARPGRARPGR